MIRVLLLAVFALFSELTVQNQDNAMVYICTGSSAYAYHCNRNCSGLRKCTGDIKRVTIEIAKSKGRKPCKRCYKKK